MISRGNPPARCFNDRSGDGQAQAAMSHRPGVAAGRGRLGGESGLEDFVQGICRNAPTVILDGQRELLLSARLCGATLRGPFTQVQSDLAPTGHCLRCVLNHIDQHACQVFSRKPHCECAPIGVHGLCNRRPGQCRQQVAVGQQLCRQVVDGYGRHQIPALSLP